MSSPTAPRPRFDLAFPTPGLEHTRRHVDFIWLELCPHLAPTLFTLAALRAFLEAEANAAIEHELTLEYHHRSRRNSGRRLALVGPSGLLLIFRYHKGTWSLVTAYFPKAAQIDQPELRWRRTVAYVIRRAVRWGNVLALPSLTHEVIVEQDGATVRRTHFYFAVPAAWGFVDGPNGWQWRGHLGAWEAAPRVPLRKRFRR